LMKIGENAMPIRPEIVALGFTLVDNMKLLGLKIDCTCNKLEENFDSCIQKMRQIAGNWSRFRLSLPGRIAIAKSLLLSQLAYPGAILKLTAGQLVQINSLIENFVTYGIVIARNRIYASAQDGGLGMIDVENFLHAQKCVWIRRCFFRIKDPWRWEILQRTDFSLDTVRLEFFDKNSNPILWNIMESVAKFQNSYWNKHENYLDAPIFNNDMFLQSKPRIRGPVPRRLDWTVLRRDLRTEYGNRILKMRVSDMFDEGVIVPYNRLIQSVNIPFTVNEYMVLVSTAAFAREKYGAREGSNGKCCKLSESIYKKKGSSKVFRKNLDSSKKLVEVNTLRTTKTFLNW